jgi:hypothetical protein
LFAWILNTHAGGNSPRVNEVAGDQFNLLSLCARFHLHYIKLNFPRGNNTAEQCGGWQRRGAAKMKEAEDTKKTQRKILERKESFNQKGWHLFFQSSSAT